MSESDPQPVIPEDTPLFVEDSNGRLSVVWPDNFEGTVRITREVLQMLVDRANSGRWRTT